MNKALAMMAFSMMGLVAAACGGSGGAAGSGGTGGSKTTSSHTGTGGGLTAAQACADSASARCARLQACSNGALVTSRYGDMATCVSRMQANCEAALAAPDTGNTPDNVETCSMAVPAESCPDFFDNNPPAQCETQMGARENGKPCAFPAQCLSTFCDVPKGAGCGTCGDPPAAGTPCETGADCGHDQVCVNASSTCTTPVASGGMCDKDTPCGSGLSCVGATLSAMGTCQAAVTAAGMACDSKKQTGPDCDRNLGLYCDPTAKTCAAITYADDGQPCGVVNGAVTGCKAGGLCVIPTGMTAGTCKAPAADGAACDTAAGPPCLLPARCVLGGTGTAGTCKQLDGTCM